MAQATTIDTLIANLQELQQPLHTVHRKAEELGLPIEQDMPSLTDRNAKITYLFTQLTSPEAIQYFTQTETPYSIRNMVAAGFGVGGRLPTIAKFIESIASADSASTLDDLRHFSLKHYDLLTAAPGIGSLGCLEVLVAHVVYEHLQAKLVHTSSQEPQTEMFTRYAETITGLKTALADPQFRTEALRDDGLVMALGKLLTADRS